MQFDKLTKTKTVENLLGTVSTFALLMGAWQLTVTWYKIRHTDEQELALHTGTSKTKRLYPVKFEFSLLWMTQCVACSPTLRILYHVTKGPIVMHGQ